MLSAKDNELLCRVGPGTPMGNLMREYWLPAIRSDELPAPDCPPVRIKLLGEELIGYRTTSGALGLSQNACPHRADHAKVVRHADMSFLFLPMTRTIRRVAPLLHDQRGGCSGEGWR